MEWEDKHPSALTLLMPVNVQSRDEEADVREAARRLGGSQDIKVILCECEQPLSLSACLNTQMPGMIQPPQISFPRFFDSFKSPPGATDQRRADR